jgi:hypothetical protein
LNLRTCESRRGSGHIHRPNPVKSYQTNSLWSHAGSSQVSHVSYKSDMTFILHFRTLQEKWRLKDSRKKSIDRKRQLVVFTHSAAANTKHIKRRQVLSRSHDAVIRVYHEAGNVIDRAIVRSNYTSTPGPGIQARIVTKHPTTQAPRCSTQ